MALAAVPASAVTTHSTRASFNAAAPVTTLINFNGAPDASTATSRTFGDVTFNCTGTTYCPGFFGTRSFGNGNSGSVFYATPDTATFTFANAVDAFGMDILSLGTDGATTYSAMVNGISYNIATNYSSGATLFFGLTGGSFTSVTFFGTAPNDGIDFDDLAFHAAGDVVPEPASWALLIVGFGLTGAAMRRRAQAARFA